MNHLREYDSDEEKMLGDLQNLGLSPKPHHYYITYGRVDYDDYVSDSGALCISAKSMTDVASLLFPIFGMDDELEEPDFEQHVSKYKDIEGLTSHITDVLDENSVGVGFRIWELTPINKNIPDGGECVEANLSNPVLSYELGKSKFSNFAAELKAKPYGNI